MAAIAGQVGGGFVPVAPVERVGAASQEQMGEVPAAGAGRGEQRGEAAGLHGVDRSTMFEKELNRCHVPAQRESGVEGVVALRILSDGLDRGLSSKQECDRRWGSEGCSEVKRGPAVAGKSVSESAVCLEERFELRLVADGRSFKDIKSDAVSVQAGKQKVAHQGLAAVDGPDQSGNPCESREAARVGSAWTASATSAVAPCWMSFMNGELMVLTIQRWLAAQLEDGFHRVGS